MNRQLRRKIEALEILMQKNMSNIYQTQVQPLFGERNSVTSVDRCNNSNHKLKRQM